MTFVVESTDGELENLIVSPGELLEVTIPESLEIASSSIDAKTIVVRTVNEDDLLQVFGYSVNDFTADVFLAVPIRRVSGIDAYSYAQFSTSFVGRESAFAVASCDVDPNVPNSNVATFFATAAGVNPMPFVRAKIRQRGGAIIDQDGANLVGITNFATPFVSDLLDLTGFRVTTTVPSGVTIGHICGQVLSETPTCDYIIEQSPPSYTWGYNFISSGLMRRITGYVIKIVPRHNDTITSVTYICGGDTSETTQVVSIDGLTVDVTESVTCYFRTTRPAAVVQFSRGQQSDDERSRSDDDIGDPAMAWIPPVGQYINRMNFFTGVPIYTQTVVKSYEFGEFINVIVPAEFFNASMIKLNGSALSNVNWTGVSCDQSEICAYRSSLQIPNGLHTLQHDNPDGRLSATVYGWGREIGYMYPAGYAMDPIGGIYTFSKA